MFSYDRLVHIENKPFHLLTNFPIFRFNHYDGFYTRKTKTMCYRTERSKIGKEGFVLYDQNKFVLFPGGKSVGNCLKQELTASQKAKSN